MVVEHIDVYPTYEQALRYALVSIANHPHYEVTEDDGSRHQDWETEARSMRAMAIATLEEFPNPDE